MTVTTDTTANITRHGAETVLVAIRTAAHDLGFEPATAVADLGGHLKAFERGDTTPYLAGDIAIAKAWTAASWQVSTSYWNRYLREASVTALQNMPGLMPVGGGFAMASEGRTIGAVGVSGGTLEQDEQSVLAAFTALGLTVTPDPDTA